jgi:hypothetical protein
MPLEKALVQAMEDLRHLQTPGGMNIVALDREGRPGAASNVEGTKYVYLREGMDAYVEAPRLHVPLG